MRGEDDPEKYIFNAEGAPDGMDLTLEECAKLLRGDARTRELEQDALLKSGENPPDNLISDWLRRCADLCEKFDKCEYEGDDPDGPYTW